MAVHLTLHEDTIRAKVYGDNFRENLQQIKSVPGRRYNGDEKLWELPRDFPTMQRLMLVSQPTLSPELRAWWDESADENETALASTLPDDADVPGVPYADDLFPHQRAAAAWLADHPHAIEADDMGLGKTVTAITAAMLRFSAANPGKAPSALVVCPNSITKNWQNELTCGPRKADGSHFENWVPQDTLIINGKTKKKRAAQLAEAAAGGKWVIVNWEKLRILPELAAMDFDIVIADEAHRAKNRKSQQTAALWKIKAPIQYALTGTPIQNEPSELWPLLKWLFPRDYTSYWAFFDMYVESYEAHFGPRKTKVVVGVRNAEKLRFELANKLIRRLKGDRTPGKWRQYLPVEMDAKQQKMYTEAEEAMWLDIIKDAETGDTQALDLVNNPEKLFLANGAARTTRLRQILSCPALLGSDADSAKLSAAVDIIRDASQGKQFVVFTEFKGTTEALCARLTKAGITSAALTGDTPTDRTARTPEDVRTRQELVDDFQEGLTQVLVMTRAAGGVGLTLTAASTCIFIERDWVPANNEQAEDRLNRIGQDSRVHVIILQTCDSLDDGTIQKTNRTKEMIVKSVVAQEEIQNDYTEVERLRP